MRIELDRTILITKLIHESGEEMISEMILPTVQDPQRFGSLITYYKRYQLQALLGISTSDEDDDGNSVSQPQQQSVARPPESAQASVLASDAQKRLLTNLGIKFAPNLNKSEASKLIEQANKR
jgi:hypothetical protein